MNDKLARERMSSPSAGPPSSSPSTKRLKVGDMGADDMMVETEDGPFYVQELSKDGYVASCTVEATLPSIIDLKTKKALHLDQVKSIFTITSPANVCTVCLDKEKEEDANECGRCAVMMMKIIRGRSDNIPSVEEMIKEVQTSLGVQIMAMCPWKDCAIAVPLKDFEEHFNDCDMYKKRCGFCDKMVTAHAMAVHEKQCRIKCDLCDRIVDAVKLHIHKLSNDCTRICELCEKPAPASVDGMRDHQRSIFCKHCGECPVCETTMYGRPHELFSIECCAGMIIKKPNFQEAIISLAPRNSNPGVKKMMDAFLKNPDMKKALEGHHGHHMNWSSYELEHLLTIFLEKVVEDYAPMDQDVARLGEKLYRAVTKLMAENRNMVEFMVDKMKKDPNVEKLVSSSGHSLFTLASDADLLKDFDCVLSPLKHTHNTCSVSSIMTVLATDMTVVNTIMPEATRGKTKTFIDRLCQIITMIRGGEAAPDKAINEFAFLAPNYKKGEFTDVPEHYNAIMRAIKEFDNVAIGMMMDTMFTIYTINVTTNEEGDPWFYIQLRFPESGDSFSLQETIDVNYRDEVSAGHFAIPVTVPSDGGYLTFAISPRTHARLKKDVDKRRVVFEDEEEVTILPDVIIEQHHNILAENDSIFIKRPLFKLKLRAVILCDPEEHNVCQLVVNGTRYLVDDQMRSCVFKGDTMEHTRYSNYLPVLLFYQIVSIKTLEDGVIADE